MGREPIDELLNRGLDADLDRAGMRDLYRRAADDPAVPAAMGELARLEDGLLAVGRALDDEAPAADLDARVVAALGPAPRRPGWGSRLWDWLRSPHGVSVQPLSFAAGVAVAAVMVSTPMVTRLVVGEPPRLQVHDVQFVDARARVDWTYRFIVPPGAAASLTLRAAGERPVHLRFEAEDPVELVVEHRAPGQGRDAARTVQVHGIGYASLHQPRPGDTLTVRNHGTVPVLVFAHTLGGGGSTVRPTPIAGKQAL